jgi:ferredoxin
LKLESVKGISFSPTGNSKRVAEAIARGIQAPIEYVDLTPPSSRKIKPIEFNDDLTIFSVPVYGGRVPTEAAYRIRRLRGTRQTYEAKLENKIPAVVVVTYGNRAYEDALRELGDIVSEVGFKPIAAGAFIGEHSFSVPEKPTAHGRPDSEDLSKAEEFGKKIREKYEGVDSVKSLSLVKTPGTYPYSLTWRGYLVWYDFGELATPYTDEAVCSKCGKCVDVCPIASVTIDNVVNNPSPMVGFNVQVVHTNEETCLWCCACVRNCPTGARLMRPRMLQSQEGLSKNYPERKEPETYL